MENDTMASVKKRTKAVTGKAAPDDTLTHQIAVRLSAEDFARLEGLAGPLPLATLARRALVVGLDAIEATPALLLGTPAKRGK